VIRPGGRRGIAIDGKPYENTYALLYVTCVPAIVDMTCLTAPFSLNRALVTRPARRARGFITQHPLALRPVCTCRAPLAPVPHPVWRECLPAPRGDHGYASIAQSFEPTIYEVLMASLCWVPMALGPLCRYATGTGPCLAHRLVAVYDRSPVLAIELLTAGSSVKFSPTS